MDDLPDLIAFMDKFVELHRSRSRETAVDEASVRFLEGVLADLRGAGEAETPRLVSGIDGSPWKLGGALRPRTAPGRYAPSTPHPRECLGCRSPVEVFLSELGRNVEIRFA